ncbi:hypothetical protein [Streptomyces sp. NPDC003032]
MQRRTFLTGTALGAALAAVPLGAPQHAASAAEAGAPTTVSSLNDLQRAINSAAPGASISVSGENGTRDAPITITSVSRGGAVLRGERGFVFRGSSDITVTGFSFRQSTTPRRRRRWTVPAG